MKSFVLKGVRGKVRKCKIKVLLRVHSTSHVQKPVRRGRRSTRSLFGKATKACVKVKIRVKPQRPCRRRLTVRQILHEEPVDDFDLSSLLERLDKLQTDRNQLAEDEQQALLLEIEALLEHLTAQSPKAFLKLKRLLRRESTRLKQSLPTPVTTVLQVPAELVASPALRRAVCLKIASVLESNKFPKDLAQDLSLSIERNIRARDPTMTEPYTSLCHSMLRDIYHLTLSNYTQVVPAGDSK